MLCSVLPSRELWPFFDCIVRQLKPKKLYGLDSIPGVRKPIGSSSIIYSYIGLFLVAPKPVEENGIRAP